MDGRDPTPTPTPQTSPAPITRRRALLRVLSAGGLTGLLVAVGVQIYRVALGGNVHEVIPGVVYRSSHPSPARLEALVAKYHIRTVVNLRGCCESGPIRRDTKSSYLDESRATVRLDLSQEDLPFSAGRLPSVPVIRELVKVLDRSDKPLLLHCYQGIDRTGMASAMALLLYTGSSLDDALHQLSPRYGHLPFGRTGNIDRFFELYAEWLTQQNLTHSSANFRRWVEQDYCPGECLGSVEILEPKGAPLVMRRGAPLAVRVACTNRSVKPWRFRPGTNAGIHVFWQVLKPLTDQAIAGGRAGMFHAEVPPGGVIELTLGLPALDEPGRYQLRVDLKDEQNGLFHQLGPQPLEVELEVR